MLLGNIGSCHTCGSGWQESPTEYLCGPGTPRHGNSPPKWPWQHQQNTEPCHTTKTAHQWPEVMVIFIVKIMTTISNLHRSQSDWCLGSALTSPIHQGPTFQLKVLKGSAASALVADTTGKPQRSSCHASMGQSQVWCTVGLSWIRLVHGCSTDACSDRNLGHLKARATSCAPCRVPGHSPAV